MGSKRLATDSSYLIFVRCITMITSIIQTQILSYTLTKAEYGLYSQGLLVISITTTISALGLSNAINYFFNVEKDIEKRDKYVNTIYAITVALGIIVAIFIVLCDEVFVLYFKDGKVVAILLYLCLRPLLANLITNYQTLYITNGFAKAIAIRNLVVAIVQVLAIFVVLQFTHSIEILFLVLTVLDVAQLVYFKLYYNYKGLRINIFSIDVSAIKKIMGYALPLGIATLMGTLLKDTDKLIIGRANTSEVLALYTNASKPLPFEFIASSFTSVVTPAIILLISAKNLKKLERVWADYLEISYVTTWGLCAGAIVCAPELMTFLYSDKYIDGLSVFICYIVLEMFRFTYYGMFLSARGKSKTIMLYSFITLVLNFAISLPLYYKFGIVGPAIGSVLAIALTGICQIIHGAKLVGISFVKCIRPKRLLITAVNIGISCFVAAVVRQGLIHYVDINFVVLCGTYFTFLLVYGVQIWKRCLFVFKDLNNATE